MECIFQLPSDLLHLFAIAVLIIKICTSKNSSGVSGKTQILYALVCITRHIELFYLYVSADKTSLKIAYISMHVLTIYLIYGKFRDTRSSNEDSFNISYLICGAAIVVMIIRYCYGLIEIFWTYSIYLEAVAMVPQLLMIYRDKTNETRSFIFCYVFSMGTYSALYVMNWIYRYTNGYSYDIISEFAGGVQLTIYCVFDCLLIIRRVNFVSSDTDDNLITVRI